MGLCTTSGAAYRAVPTCAAKVQTSRGELSDDEAREEMRRGRRPSLAAGKDMVCDGAISGWEPCMQVGLTSMHKGDPAQGISPFGLFWY